MPKRTTSTQQTYILGQVPTKNEACPNHADRYKLTLPRIEGGAWIYEFCGECLWNMIRIIPEEKHE